MRLVLAIAVVLGLAAERADACACCDAQTSRTVLGWSETEVLLDFGTDVACSPKRALEVWKIGASEPARCYDLFGTPDKAIDCDLVSMREDPADRAQEPKASKQLAKFPRKVVPLSPARIVTKTRWEQARSADWRPATVTVTIATKQVLSETFDSVDPSPTLPQIRVDAYAAPNGKRALLLLSYRQRGNGNQVVEVRWVELRK